MVFKVSRVLPSGCFRSCTSPARHTLARPRPREAVGLVKPEIGRASRSVTDQGRREFLISRAKLFSPAESLNDASRRDGAYNWFFSLGESSNWDPRVVVWFTSEFHRHDWLVSAIAYRLIYRLESTLEGSHECMSPERGKNIRYS